MAQVKLLVVEIEHILVAVLVVRIVGCCVSGIVRQAFSRFFYSLVVLAYVAIHRRASSLLCLLAAIESFYSSLGMGFHLRILDDELVSLRLYSWNVLHRFFLHFCAVGLGSKHLVDKLWFLAQSFERQLRSHLLAFLLAEARTGASLYCLKHHLIVEHGRSGLVFFLREDAEVNAHAVLLTPFDELALEVYFLISNLVDVYHLCQYSLAHKLHACVVATVEVYCSHKSLEGVASHV